MQSFPSPLQRLKANLLQPNVLGALLKFAGSALVAHDILDLGWGSYRREERPYHPDTTPGLHAGRVGDHPSSVHHWQLGVLLEWAGQYLQAIAAKKPGASK